MNSENSHFEANVKRLLGAALEEHARPSPQARSHTISMLAKRLNAQRTVFPEPVLGILGIMVLFGLLWWLGSIANLNPTTVPTALRYSIQFLGALNLLVVPFAGLVIFIRRRSSNVSAD